MTCKHTINQGVISFACKHITESRQFARNYRRSAFHLQNNTNAHCDFGNCCLASVNCRCRSWSSERHDSFMALCCLSRPACNIATRYWICYTTHEIKHNVFQSCTYMRTPRVWTHFRSTSAKHPRLICTRYTSLVFLFHNQFCSTQVQLTAHHTAK